MDINPAANLGILNLTPTTLDTQPDLMFSSPVILLKQGSQRMFTEMIKSLRDKPTRKSTTTNLDRIRCCVTDAFGYEPTDMAIWTSIRSNITRLTRNFLWKTMHNTFRVGLFWDNVPNLEIFGQCATCRVPESLEHSMLECDAPGQRQIWQLVEKLWMLRYTSYPNLNWGLLLGCALAKFKSPRGCTVPAKNWFFTILVSTSMHLIWKLRNKRIFETHTLATHDDIIVG